MTETTEHMMPHPHVRGAMTPAPHYRCKLCGHYPPQQEKEPSNDITCKQAYAMYLAARVEWEMMEIARLEGKIDRYREAISNQYHERYKLIWQKVS